MADVEKEVIIEEVEVRYCLHLRVMKTLKISREPLFTNICCCRKSRMTTKSPVTRRVLKKVRSIDDAIYLYVAETLPGLAKRNGFR